MKRSLLMARDRALYRGLAFLERETRRPERLAAFGSALLYSLSFMATTSRDATVRAYTRQLALRSFRAWQAYWPGQVEAHDADTVSELVHAYGAAERLGLRFPRLKRELLALSRRFPASDYLWFDPNHEPPPTNVPETCACGWSNPRGRRRCVNPECRARLSRMSPLRLWTISLTAAFCGDRNGVPFGVRYERMMRWLPHMRGYAHPRRGVGGFYDSAYAISHVVYTLNDYGVWLLDPRLLPHEFEYLTTHLEAALEVGDPDMVGEFLDSLRAFGLDNEDPHVAAGIGFLVETQNRDGSWGERDGALDYTRFHATWAALDGLRDFAWRGAGLSFPRLAPSLRRWARLAPPVS
ncbi:hypothetical protein [Pyxidicoccus xibeiensis]|uniref:hypothetical protein n=1 Tax=Pyxidicoccus xibeiensis TaxID=2906759 RepID=UPI0020A7C767|nr:hypothetical protein [Pyxidicoccus xibeiensis]MCP3139483.1 hypothetical protein [Pyxidicoccus xibeiensis]